MPWVTTWICILCPLRKALLSLAVSGAENDKVANTSDEFMEAVGSPLAEALAAPTLTARSQLASVPPFSDYAVELQVYATKSQEMHVVSATGTRLMYLMNLRLQRSDMKGAKEALEDAMKLPSPESILGPELWDDSDRRLLLCDSFGKYVEHYVASNGLLSMLETGVLTPKLPQHMQIGIPDVDDERYLRGTISASHELERYAVNRGRELDLHSVRLCLEVVRSLQQALMQFNFRNSDLRRSFDSVKYVVKNLETLTYEVDLALKRSDANRATSTILSVTESTMVSEEPAAKREKTKAIWTDSEIPQRLMALDLKLIKDIKERYDSFDEVREQTIKRSRDVQKHAKNAIYALQRDDLWKADVMLKQATRDAGMIYAEFVSKTPSLRKGSFSSALEELVEALAYRAFRKDHILASRAAIQDASDLPFAVSLLEYLGGLMDLSGEIGRLAVVSASRGWHAIGEVELSFTCVDALYEGLQTLPFLPGELSKKLQPLKDTLTKIEGILSDIAHFSHTGMFAQASANTNTSKVAEAVHHSGAASTIPSYKISVQANLPALEPPGQYVEPFTLGYFVLAFFVLVLIGLQRFRNIREPLQGLQSRLMNA